MTLTQYIKELQELVLKNPEHGDLEVVYSRDDEGNGFQRVHYSPGVGIFEDGDFIHKSQLEEWEREESDINAVCIN
jgi:protein involved in sex pheromone biosynthesis